MKLKHLNIVILAISICATFGIEHLIRPEEITSLYKFNFAVIVLIEILIVNALYFTAKKDNYSIQSIAVAKQIIIYGILCAIWLAGFNLFLLKNDIIEIKYYYVVHILLFAWYSIMTLVVYVAGKKQIEVNKSQKNNVAHQEAIKNDIISFKLHVSKQISESKLDVTTKNKARAKLDLVCDKLRFNTTIMTDSHLQLILEDTKTLSKNLDHESSSILMMNKLNEIVEYINLKK